MERFPKYLLSSKLIHSETKLLPLPYGTNNENLYGILSKFSELLLIFILYDHFFLDTTWSRLVPVKANLAL